MKASTQTLLLTSSTTKAMAIANEHEIEESDDIYGIAASVLIQDGYDLDELLAFVYVIDDKIYHLKPALKMLVIQIEGLKDSVVGAIDMLAPILDDITEEFEKLQLSD